VGLRLRSDPLERHGRVWQRVVDVDEGLPALTDVLAGCQGFLVDDDCGRAVGVVEDVVMDPDSSGPARLLVVQSWGRRRLVVPLDEVVEVAPGGRRLVTACRAGHLPQAERTGRRTWMPAGAITAVRSLVSGVAGRIWRSQRR
jgi:hypothetical protein